MVAEQIAARGIRSPAVLRAMATVRRERFVPRLAPLAEKAARRLADEGFDNVHVHVGDGTVGRPEDAPFDAILVTAAGPRVPTSLLAQLAPGGRLVMPVGSSGAPWTLTCITSMAPARHAAAAAAGACGGPSPVA